MQNINRTSLRLTPIILLAIVISLSIYRLKRPFHDQFSAKDYCLKARSSFFSGRIYKTSIDYENKSAFDFFVINGKDTSKHNLYLIIQRPELYIQEGDSIIKESDVSEFKIYRKCNPDSLLILDFDCSYWENKNEK